MNLEALYAFCADPDITDQQVLQRIVELKRAKLDFTEDEEDKICAILKRCKRIDLAEKCCRNLKRHRALPR